MNKWVNWFEIPATDFERAKNFYSSIFGIELFEMEMMGTRMGMFPTADNESGGAIVYGEDYKPSAEGCVVYLNGGNNLDTVLGKVAGQGGNVIVPKMSIGEGMGHIAMFIDTEGNKVALHSMH